MQDSVWFVPYNADSGKLQAVSAGEQAAPDAAGVIGPGRPFTVSLEALKRAKRPPAPQEPWYDRLIHRATTS